MPDRIHFADSHHEAESHKTEVPPFERATEELAVHEYLPEGASPSDPGFVLVHGAMDRSTSMGKLAKLLGAQPVVTYDRRGYAASLIKSPPEGVSDLVASKHLSDLAGLISKRPTVVFGHSLGGTIALLCAATIKPANLTSVIVFESPLPAKPWWPSWLARRNELLKTLDQSHYEQRGENFMRRMIGDSSWQRLPPSTRRARIEEGYTLVTEGAAFASFESDFDLGEITVPVTSVIGEHASYRHRLGQKYILDHVRDVTACCVSGASHVAHLTHARALAEICLDRMADFKKTH